MFRDVLAGSDGAGADASTVFYLGEISFKCIFGLMTDYEELNYCNDMGKMLVGEGLGRGQNESQNPRNYIIN